MPRPLPCGTCRLQSGVHRLWLSAVSSLLPDAATLPCGTCRLQSGVHRLWLSAALAARSPDAATPAVRYVSAALPPSLLQLGARRPTAVVLREELYTTRRVRPADRWRGTVYGSCLTKAKRVSARCAWRPPGFNPAYADGREWGGQASGAPLKGSAIRVGGPKNRQVPPGQLGSGPAVRYLEPKIRALSKAPLPVPGRLGAPSVQWPRTNKGSPGMR